MYVADGGTARLALDAAALGAEGRVVPVPVGAAPEKAAATQAPSQTQVLVSCGTPPPEARNSAKKAQQIIDSKPLSPAARQGK